jgi:hypothetical protein
MKRLAVKQAAYPKDRSVGRRIILLNEPTLDIRLTCLRTVSARAGYLGGPVLDVAETETWENDAGRFGNFWCDRRSGCLELLLLRFHATFEPAAMEGTPKY